MSATQAPAEPEETAADQMLGRYAIQADELRDVLDELAPHTEGNLVARVRAVATQAPADRTALEQIRQHLNVMMGSAIPDFDGGNNGDVMGYHIRTGALHKIIGLLSGLGLAVNIPSPYGLRNGKCCGHTNQCRDSRCSYATRETP